MTSTLGPGSSRGQNDSGPTGLRSRQRVQKLPPLDFETLKSDPDHIAQHFINYIKGISANVRLIFSFVDVEKMRGSNVLFRRNLQERAEP